VEAADVAASAAFALMETLRLILRMLRALDILLPKEEKLFLVVFPAIVQNTNVKFV